MQPRELWFTDTIMYMHPILGYDAKKGLQCDSSDEDCSRSSSVRSRAKQHVLGAELVGSVPNNRSRKRKTKKKKKTQLASSLSIFPVSDDVSRASIVVKDFEDPLPQRRNDLLRGGATSLQQVSPEFNALLEHSGAKILKPTVTPIVPSSTSRTQDKGESCVKQMENESPSVSGTSPKRRRQLYTNRQRRRLRWRRSVHRQPALWSRLSRSHMRRQQFCVSFMRSCACHCT